MRLVFVTASLMPERCGVSDHVIALADAMAARGHQCLLLALRDVALATDHEAGCRPGPFYRSPLPTRRLGVGCPAAVRARLVRGLLDAWQPDCVSLHFVPYAFHRRGLPIVEQVRLHRLLRGQMIHLMLHELSVGGAGAPLAERFIGLLQRDLVIAPLLRWRALHWLTTSNRIYAQRLAALGARAEVLPLFGTIPNRGEIAGEWLWSQLEPLGLIPSERGHYWMAGVFGSLYPAALEPSFIRACRDAAAIHGRRLVLLAAGRMTAPGAACWTQRATRFANEVPMINLGPLDPQRASGYFNALDFGIAATPLALLGKSSVAWAMHEHGLPLLAPRDDVPGLVGLDPLDDPGPAIPLRPLATLATRLAVARRGTPHSRLPAIAARFEAGLMQRYPRNRPG